MTTELKATLEALTRVLETALVALAAHALVGLAFEGLRRLEDAVFERSACRALDSVHSGYGELEQSVHKPAAPCQDGWPCDVGLHTDSSTSPQRATAATKF